MNTTLYYFSGSGNSLHNARGEECEMCHACIQWCPQRAIEYGELSQNRVRYRHPQVRLAEMLQR